MAILEPSGGRGEHGALMSNPATNLFESGVEFLRVVSSEVDSKAAKAQIGTYLDRSTGVPTNSDTLDDMHSPQIPSMSSDPLYKLVRVQIPNVKGTTG